MAVVALATENFRVYAVTLNLGLVVSIDWVAVKELSLTYYIGETILMTRTMCIYIYIYMYRPIMVT